MRKLVFLVFFSLCYYMGIGTFNNVRAFETTSFATISQSTYSTELKTMPNDAYLLAKLTFLPDAGESQFSGNKVNNDYSQKDICSDTSNLYTAKTCSYPKTVVPSSKCPFRPGYYTECKCLPKFSLSSCASPYVLGGDSCDGKYEKCVCPASVSLTYPNDRCTKYCDGKCIAKTCSPTANETGCQYGTGSTSNGCGGTRTYCKACSPKPNETGCKYGTFSCSDGCNGTRTCCSEKPADPCEGITCGTNASCSAGKCYCNTGYEGDAYSTCTLKTCDFPFYYSDQTQSDGLNKNKTAIGIVVDDLIVSIYDFTGNKSYDNGAYSTFTKNGIAGWTAPSMNGALKIYQNKAAINKCMDALGAPKVLDDWYWTKDKSVIDEFNMKTKATNLNDSSAYLRIRLVK